MKNVRIKAEEIEICGVRLALGKRYIIELENGGKYDGEYAGYSKTENAINIIPGMLNVLLPIGKISKVEVEE